ncbi:hypothetical protein A0128_06905 [Leptospira tipperaryensis]|uniref:Uncharacterized protein n=1 Tax=Leptospira tipperaryensis TaxID=2564040 RepID=A0A1D7UVG8_9LEPT|nr:hypothetical protein [Leptospira tipperaryensis]AOP33600.1 hypothetical protein A0128_06905 [Leptospira tipperaryensis]
MRKEFLVRLGAYSAVMAGILRCFASFAGEFLSGFYLEILYSATDICILFAVLGFYFRYYEGLKRLAWIGFVFCMIGIGLLIGPDESASGWNVYPYGAGILSFGLILIGIDSWKWNILAKWIPSFWMLSVLLGSVGFLLSGGTWLFAIAGVLFGIGFIGMGFSLLGSLPSSKLELDA